MNRIIEDIVPFKGYCEFLLYQSINEAKTVIKNHGMKYTLEVWGNNECTNPVPWTIIRIDDNIHLFFAKDKLFKIYLSNRCDAKLPNGISIGMQLSEALAIDPTLEYDDWEEDYQSPQGYWLEDDLDNGTVMSISVFIKEALDEELFEKYKW